MASCLQAGAHTLEEGGVKLGGVEAVDQEPRDPPQQPALAYLPGAAQFSMENSRRGSPNFNPRHAR